MEIVMKYIVFKLAVINSGTTFMKIKTMLSLAFVSGIFGTVLTYLTNWYLSDEKYLEYVLGAILFDLFFGVWKHIKDHNFDAWKLLLGLLKKTAIVVSTIYMYGGIDAIITEESIVKSYFIITLRLGVFMYPALSGFANMYIISKGKFPPKVIMDRFTDFGKNQDVKELIDIKKE